MISTSDLLDALNGDWNYQRVKALARDSGLVHPEDLEQVSSKLELLTVIAQRALAIVAQGVAVPAAPSASPVDPEVLREVITEALSPIAQRLETMSGRLEAAEAPPALSVDDLQAAFATALTPLGAQLEDLAERVATLEPQPSTPKATANVGTWPVWLVLGGEFVYGSAKNESELVALETAAAALAPELSQETTPALSELPGHLKPWRDRPRSTPTLARTEAPTSSSSTSKRRRSPAQRAAASVINVDQLPIRVERQGPGFVATSEETGRQVFGGMTPNEARSKCAAAIVSARVDQA